jgi:hypothetical protein
MARPLGVKISQRKAKKLAESVPRQEGSCMTGGQWGMAAWRGDGGSSWPKRLKGEVACFYFIAFLNQILAHAR